MSLTVGRFYRIESCNHVEPDVEFVKAREIVGATQHRRYVFDIWTYGEQGDAEETESSFDLSVKRVNALQKAGKITLIPDISRLHMDKDGDVHELPAQPPLWGTW